MARVSKRSPSSSAIACSFRRVDAWSTSKETFTTETQRHRGRRRVGTEEPIHRGECRARGGSQRPSQNNLSSFSVSLCLCGERAQADPSLALARGLDRCGG